METSLDVNAEDLQAWSQLEIRMRNKNHNLKICHKSFERVEQFRYLGNKPKNQNLIHEKFRAV